MDNAVASGSFDSNLHTIAANANVTGLITATSSPPVIVNISPTLLPTPQPTYQPGAPTPVPTAVPSTSGYVYTTIYADICYNNTSSGDAIYQIGYLTYDCLPVYNSNGTIVGSRYITCNVTSSTLTSYYSSDCNASTIVDSVTTDNNACSSSTDWFNPTLGRSQVTQCLEYPTSYRNGTELLSSVLPFDAVLTTSYGIGSGCNNTIVEFSAIATDICLSTLYNSTYEQGKRYVCYGNGVVGYYEYYPVPTGFNNTCALYESEDTLSSECELLQISSDSNSTAYFSLTQCYIATSPAAEPTMSPTYTPTYAIGSPTPQPTYTPTVSPTPTPTYFPTAPTPFQYVLFNKYIDETCYGDVDQQVGYLTNTCIPDVNGSSIVSCTSQNITFQDFSTSDCFGEFNTTTIYTNNCMKGNIAGFCKETGSYYDLVLMDSGN